MEGATAPVIYRAAMTEDPKGSQSAEDWIEELVRRLNEALIAGGRIMAVEFEDTSERDDTGSQHSKDEAQIE
jgi:hypothetical protein